MVQSTFNYDQTTMQQILHGTDADVEVDLEHATDGVSEAEKKWAGRPPHVLEWSRPSFVAMVSDRWIVFSSRVFCLSADFRR